MQENSPIDYDQLNEMLGGIDDELLNQALGVYRTNLLELTKEIEQAVTARSSEAVRRAAHSAKGASLSICAVDLSETFKTLQDAGESNDWEIIDASMGALKEQRNEMIAYLDGKLG